MLPAVGRSAHVLPCTELFLRNGRSGVDRRRVEVAREKRLGRGELLPRGGHRAGDVLRGREVLPELAGVPVVLVAGVQPLRVPERVRVGSRPLLYCRDEDTPQSGMLSGGGLAYWRAVMIGRLREEDEELPVIVLGTAELRV